MLAHGCRHRVQQLNLCMLMMCLLFFVCSRQIFQNRDLWSKSPKKSTVFCFHSILFCLFRWWSYFSSVALAFIFIVLELHWVRISFIQIVATLERIEFNKSNSKQNQAKRNPYRSRTGAEHNKLMITMPPNIHHLTMLAQNLIRMAIFPSTLSILDCAMFPIDSLCVSANGFPLIHLIWFDMIQRLARLLSCVGLDAIFWAHAICDSFFSSTMWILIEFSL